MLQRPENYPGLPARKTEDEELRFWLYGRRETTWTVFLAESGHVLRRIVWDRIADMRDPGYMNVTARNPTYYGADVCLPDELWNSILEKLSNIPILLACDTVRHISLDCWEAGVERKAKYTWHSAFKIRWRIGCVMEWQELEKWFEIVTEKFESLFPENLAPIS